MSDETSEADLDCITARGLKALALLVAAKIRNRDEEYGDPFLYLWKVKLAGQHFQEAAEMCQQYMKEAASETRTERN